MTIIWVKGNTVVSIPTVKYGFLLSMRNKTSLMEWRLCMVCLSHSMVI